MCIARRALEAARCALRDVHSRLLVPESLLVLASLDPTCASSADVLYTLGCASPPVRQRAKVTANYALASDDSSFSLTGSVNMAAQDVATFEVDEAYVVRPVGNILRGRDEAKRASRICLIAAQFCPICDAAVYHDVLSPCAASA